MPENLLRYKKAPIVEAVIELQFSQEISWERVTAAADHLKPSYFFDDTENEQGLHVQPANVQIAIRPFGRLLTSLEGTDVAAVRLNSFLASRRAPYETWDPFLARFLDNWHTARKDLGVNAINQMGVRFINRVDVPIEDGQDRAIADFLTVGPRFPEQIGDGPLKAFTVQFERDLGDEQLVKVTTALIDSPVPNCAGLLLDLDVIWRPERVVREDEIAERANVLRGWKNQIFELSITDRVRELIS